MMNKKTGNTYELLTEEFNISPKVLDVVNKAEDEIKDLFASLDDIMAFNQYKVLSVFQENRVGASHFSWQTGYGYNDAGRETLENVFGNLQNRSRYRPPDNRKRHTRINFDVNRDIKTW